MGFTHVDGEGHPVMVDVSGKSPSMREARAEGWVHLPPAVYAAVASREVKKGDVLGVAEIAGIQGAKQTAALIPLCHPLRLDEVRVRCHLDASAMAIHVESVVRARDVTGVEMEALMAVSVATLTVYDMCKAIDKGMRIEGIRLTYKSGGKSGVYTLTPEHAVSSVVENGFSAVSERS